MVNRSHYCSYFMLIYASPGSSSWCTWRAGGWMFPPPNPSPSSCHLAFLVFGRRTSVSIRNPAIVASRNRTGSFAEETDQERTKQPRQEKYFRSTTEVTRTTTPATPRQGSGSALGDESLKGSLSSWVKRLAVSSPVFF